jgi:hypothetical protein
MRGFRLATATAAVPLRSPQSLQERPVRLGVPWDQDRGKLQPAARQRSQEGKIAAAYALPLRPSMALSIAAWMARAK